MTEKFLGPIANLKQVPASLFREDVISGSADDWHEVLILSRSGRPAARFVPVPKLERPMLRHISSWWADDGWVQLKSAKSAFRSMADNVFLDIGAAAVPSDSAQLCEDDFIRVDWDAASLSKESGVAMKPYSYLFGGAAYPVFFSVDTFAIHADASGARAAYGTMYVLDCVHHALYALVLSAISEEALRSKARELTNYFFRVSPSYSSHLRCVWEAYLDAISRNKIAVPARERARVLNTSGLRKTAILHLFRMESTPVVIEKYNRPVAVLLPPAWPTQTRRPRASYGDEGFLYFPNMFSDCCYTSHRIDDYVGWVFDNADERDRPYVAVDNAETYCITGEAPREEDVRNGYGVGDMLMTCSEHGDGEGIALVSCRWSKFDDKGCVLGVPHLRIFVGHNDDEFSSGFIVCVVNVNGQYASRSSVPVVSGLYVNRDGLVRDYMEQSWVSGRDLADVIDNIVVNLRWADRSILPLLNLFNRYCTV